MLVATGLALLPVATYLVRTLVPERRVFFARWGFSHVIQVLAAGYLATLAIGVAAKQLGWIDPDNARPISLLCLSAVSLLVPCLVARQFAIRCEVIGWRALGFPPGRDPRALFAAVVALVFLLPVLLGVSMLWPSLLELLGGEPVQQEVMLKMLSLEGGELVLGLAIAIVVQPFLEEVLFRGFLQPLLVQNLSDRGGVVATSVLFAALHGSSAFLPVFVLSLGIGGLMLRTRRLSAAWLMHALHNATMFLLASLAESATSL